MQSWGQVEGLLFLVLEDAGACEEPLGVFRTVCCPFAGCIFSRSVASAVGHGPGSCFRLAGSVGLSPKGRGMPRFCGRSLAPAWRSSAGGTEHLSVARRYRRFPKRFPRARLCPGAWCSRSLLPQHFLAGKSPFALSFPRERSARKFATGSVPAGRSIPGRRALQCSGGRAAAAALRARLGEPGTGGAASAGTRSRR